MVGNDIVDLQDAETADGATHPRFDRRVFTDDEMEILAGATEPRRTRWLLWACKEAAFKALAQTAPSLRLHPGTFSVALLSPDSALVAHERGVVRVFVVEAAGFVHAVAGSWSDRAVDPVTAVLHGVGEVVAGDPHSPGRIARAGLVDRVAAHMGIDRRRLAMLARGRIPMLALDGVPLRAAVSLSHHGRLAAFACRLPPGRGGVVRGGPADPGFAWTFLNRRFAATISSR